MNLEGKKVKVKEADVSPVGVYAVVLMKETKLYVALFPATHILPAPSPANTWSTCGEDLNRISYRERIMSSFESSIMVFIHTWREKLWQANNQKNKTK